MADSRRYVLDKLYGNKYPETPVGLQNEVDSIYGLLRNTVIQKRGRQCILLGARATGKTMIINAALNKMTQDFPGQSIIIRINGLFHSDDKLALREIAKQLDDQIKNGDESIEKPSMSQTLKSMNQLFDNAASELLNAEEGGEVRQPKSVIFVVEELDRYTTSHQVLIYELFDLSHNSPVGVTIIGTSTRMNVVDLLEKRNRSRNSAVIHTFPKPASPDHLHLISTELLRNPDGVEYVDPEALREIEQQVYTTTNSVRHLASQLVPYVLGIADQSPIMQHSTSELLLSPIDTVPELDWAMLICAARAVVRYETQSVNLVIVLDEWRSSTSTDHANRFMDMTAHMLASGSSQTGQNGHNENEQDLDIDGASAPLPTVVKPGSTPSSLRAVRNSWERLKNLGLLEPVNAQSSQEDLQMVVPELDLDDLRDMLPRTFSLYSWTRIE